MFDVIHKKTQTQNFPIFLIQTAKLSISLEELNNPPVQSTGELWPSAKIAMVTFCGILIFYQKFVFDP